ncbi:MAG: hypothetical protein A2469_00120 [Candidatus Magasanikbacteria bacterium RIFOXYC2_FULL_40_16]|uniref:CMP/dCMP-type deaminase domain-containing protein n=2 Tax=Candidatus Magasanikiibacteriota TaxID=1752731 RepID=A0A1F6P0G2_9BACT|nr:MAG: hypothetical protein A2224_02555 [Candidatus Magasanikbacteria bacterium RIFOXYA2_FULL_40_20]OGH86275.1 MAG: hypothetical protein A2301_03795 [Candidatus Magasanikbacteria bacterium RIFOXYB2_FULL_40_13]OGH87176.1 MAG: hypothetical protein A2206_03850 [Candidatus Magasanikbacteria bacterium RIFOXYA1_FULL_40_8]OGH89667.1 MAG: hypothetical protein A2469_00120 [Candidatus Magasanikbacteria bacterium RIFOXYC2_FULL_40_16]
MEITNIHNLSEYEKKLIEVARAARKNAVPPVSNYQVGAAVLTASGKIFPGANIEDAGLNSTVHAEVSAISAANAAGSKNIRTLAVCGGDSGSEVFLMPCLHCWQFICNFTEVIGNEIKIIGVHSEGDGCSIGSTNDGSPDFLGWRAIGADLDRWRK